MKMENSIEDLQPSPSLFVQCWEGQACVLQLEVRDAVEGAGINFRLGEVFVRTRLGDPIGLRIERTGILF